MSDRQYEEDDFSLKKLFFPLTTSKAIHIIIFVGFLVFGNMLFNNFVEDDLSYIIENPLTHSINISYAFGPNLFNGAGQYRPIPAFYFSLLYTLFSNTPFFYHFLQLILHILCSVLIYILLNKFFSKGIAFFLSLLFLVHPINVESVSYISQSVNPLFCISGILAFFIGTKKIVTKKEWIITFLLLLLSILTKETGILFLLLIFFFRFLFIKRDLFIFTIGGISTVFVYFFIRFFIGAVGLSSRPLIPIADTTFTERLITIPEIIFFYLKTFFFPLELAVDQQWVVNKISLYNFYIPLFIDFLFFLIIFLLGIYLLRKNREKFNYLLFFSFWLVIGLALHVQIFPLDKTVADRWFYFPMVGMLGILGVALSNIKFARKNVKLFAVSSGVLIIVVFSLRTVIRNFDWRDQLALYSHDITYNDNFDIENGIGVAYGKEKDYSKALSHLKRSVQMRPFENNLTNLAIINARIGEMKNAKLYFEQALKAKDYKLYQPHKHALNLYKNYVLLLLFYEKSSSVIPLLKTAIHDYPDSSVLWFYLSLAYYMQHDQANSLTAATKAYDLQPNQQTQFTLTQIQNREVIDGNFQGFNGEYIMFNIK